MKKKVLLFLISIFLISLVSAAYECSGTVSTEEGLINVWQIKSINGVKIALVDSSGGAAEILIDAKKLTLTSEVNFTNFTLAEGFHKINLTKVLDSVVSIKVDNDFEGNLEKNRRGEIRNLSFYVSSLSGTYPGEDANVEFFVGDRYFFLYDLIPEDVHTIGSTEYLFKVSSSGSLGATIQVQKCDGGDFIEINESIEQDSGDSDINDSLLQNESLIEGNTTNVNLTGSENLQDKNLSQIVYTVILIAVIIAVLVVFFILYKLYKKKI